MHLFSKTKCIFKYKCMHVNARGYGMYLLSLVKQLSWLDMTAEQQEIWLINVDLLLISPACYLKYTLFSSDMY